MTRFIAVTSGKGGVGKTTTAVNMASALTQRDHDTVLVDANLSTPHVHHHLGHPGVDQCIYDAITERKHIAELIHDHQGLQIVPALSTVERLKRPDYEGLKYALTDLNGYTDTVVIDGSPGFNREAVVPLEVADEILVVCNPEPPSVNEAAKAVEVASELGRQVLGVVLNKVERGESMTMEDVEDELDIPVLSTVPYDRRVRTSWNRQEALVDSHPNTRAAKGFDDIAELLV